MDGLEKTKKDDQLIEDIRVRGLRLTQSSASKDQICPYCREGIRAGDLIAGQYGVRWGHPGCVILAFDTSLLIPSINKPWLTPMRVANRLRGYPKETEPGIDDFKQKIMASLQIPAEVLSPKTLKDRIRERSKEETPNLKKVAEDPRVLVSSCSHFIPQHIDNVVMPKSCRPSKTVMNEPGFDELLEKVWKELIDRRFSMYLATTRELPACPVHQSAKCYVELKVGKSHLDAWRRSLWLRCPGDDIVSGSAVG